MEVNGGELTLTSLDEAVDEAADERDGALSMTDILSIGSRDW